MGDFNEPLVEEDKFGGRSVSINRSLLFKECLDICNMLDMGFSSPRYTLTNKRDFNNLILERIDRFFANLEWCLLYPEAKVSYLPRCHSDHCPILMETHPTRPIMLNRPFRFQSFWLSNLSFPGIVSQTWINSRNLEESITRFTNEAATWNKNQFGNIHGKKKRSLARIYGVQHAIALNPSASLISFENQLHNELEFILD